VQKQHPKKRQAATIPRVIAISSGKGGVGKSSIAVNLGITLAKQGNKVCLFDADTGLANVNILLGLTPEYTLEHVLFGAKTIDEIMLEAPHGLKVVPGANGIGECVSLHPRQQQRLTRELAKVEDDFDFLLIDTAAGIAPTTLDFVSASQHTMVVITPEPTSLTDAFSLIKLLKKRNSAIHYHVVVNMCSGASQAKETYHRFSAAVEKYIGIETQYLGFILRDESIRAAVSLQNPVALFPDTDPSSRSFIRLAERIDNNTIDVVSTNSFSGYWHRQSGAKANGEPNTPIKPASELPTPEAKDNGYLSELRSRLLLLIDQGHSDELMIQQLIEEVLAAYINRFEHSPIDVVNLVEQVVGSPNRDDQLLRKIYDAVQHWGPKKPVSLVNELLSSSPVPDPMIDVKQHRKTASSSDDAAKDNQASADHVDNEPVLHSAEPSSQPDPDVKSVICITPSTHRFNKTRFGSQEALVDVLQENQKSALSLAELLEQFR